MDGTADDVDWTRLLPPDLPPGLVAGIDEHEDDPVRRRQLFQIHAVKCGRPEVARRLAASAAASSAAASCAPGGPDRWRPSWVTAAERDVRLLGSLDGHRAPVRAVATTAIDGHPVALTADLLGVLATWDLATGRLLGTGIRAGEEGPVLAMAAATLDGRPVAVTGGHDGRVRVWDLLTQSLLAAPFAGHGGVVGAVAATVLGSRPAVVSGGADRTVRVWDLLTGAALRPPEPSYGEVTAVAAGVLAGRPWVFSGDGQGSVMAWALDTGETRAAQGHHGGVLAVAVAEVAGRAVGVSSSHDTSMRVWDLVSGQPLGEPFGDLKAAVWSIGVMASPAGPVLVTGRADGEVGFFRLAGRASGAGGRAYGDAGFLGLAGRDPEAGGSAAGPRLAADPLRGHSGKVYSVATAELGGHPIVVTGGEDGMARVWDLAAQRPDLTYPLPAHGIQAVSAALARVPDGPAIAVVGDTAGALWLRDARSGCLLAGPLSGHTAIVASPAVAVLGATPIAVTASADRTVRIWDLAAGTQLGAPLIVADRGSTPIPCVATAVLHGRPIAATAGAGHPLQVWDLADRRVLAAVPPDDVILALAAVSLAGRPLFVAGNADGALRLWDAESCEPVGVPMTGHEGPVTAIGTAVVDGRPIAVTGGRDGTVRVWDLPACVPMGAPVAVHTAVVRAVAVTGLDGRPVAVSGGDDRTVRTSDLRTGAEAAPPYATAHEVRDLVATDAGVLVVALDTLLLAPLTPRS